MKETLKDTGQGRTGNRRFHAKVSDFLSMFWRPCRWIILAMPSLFARAVGRRLSPLPSDMTILLHFGSLKYSVSYIIQSECLQTKLAVLGYPLENCTGSGLCLGYFANGSTVAMVSCRARFNK